MPSCPGPSAKSDPGAVQRGEGCCQLIAGDGVERGRREHCATADDADGEEEGERMEHISADHNTRGKSINREGMLQERARRWGDILDQVSPGPPLFFCLLLSILSLLLIVTQHNVLIY